MSPTFVGVCAGSLTTLSFIPQVVKSWRRRSVADLSLTMLLAFAAGVVLWCAYGVMTDAWPIVATNAVTLILALGLIAMKAFFK